MNGSCRRAILACLSAGVLLAPLCLAQYRVNNQIYGNTGPSVTYNGGASSLGARTSVAMRSEVRNAQFRAGATPSEIRANRAQIGPLAPGGAMAYIPQEGPRYSTGSVGTSLNYLGPQQVTRSLPPPVNSYSMGASSGSIRYAAPSAAPTVGTFNVNTAALFPPPSFSGSSLNSFSPAAVQLNNAPVGSIRYSP